MTDEKTKNYLGIEGNIEYGRIVQQLLFGQDSALVASGAKTAQAPGGTGALRIAAEFVVRNGLAKTVWISDPTWANHVSVFQAAGLSVKWYKYYDAASKGLDFAAMQASLAEVQAGDLVLLHGCCHNPTGIDPTADQWRALAKQSAAAGWLPLFDFAYQGFARGIEEDAEGLRIFAECHDELLVASSFSKNFGLYNERVGAFTLVSATKEIADVAFTQVKTVIRANYSNPPSHGAAVVTAVVSDPALYAEWVEEVAAMRVRIREMRELLVEKLAARGVNQDFSFIREQNGMFSFSGLQGSGGAPQERVCHLHRRLRPDQRGRYHPRQHRSALRCHRQGVVSTTIGIRSVKARRGDPAGFSFPGAGLSDGAYRPQQGAEDAADQLATHLAADGTGHALGGGLHHAVVLAATGPVRPNRMPLRASSRPPSPLDGCPLPCSPVVVTLPPLSRSKADSRSSGVS